MHSNVLPTYQRGQWYLYQQRIRPLRRSGWANRVIRELNKTAAPAPSQPTHSWSKPQCRTRLITICTINQADTNNSIRPLHKLDKLFSMQTSLDQTWDTGHLGHQYQKLRKARRTLLINSVRTIKGPISNSMWQYQEIMTIPLKTRITHHYFKG